MPQSPPHRSSDKPWEPPMFQTQELDALNEAHALSPPPVFLYPSVTFVEVPGGGCPECGG